jgi:NAD(P)-dependent dehydrogenase (short-subunit alcohol dehydrogenase family)
MTDQPLAGQVAVVTGAGRGIGRVIALALGAAGVTVAAVSRTEGEVEATAAAITSAGARAAPFVADVTDHAAVEALAESVMATLGPVDLLVNNAGTHAAIGHLWDVDPDLWWRDVESNLHGTFLPTRVFLPAMLARGAGCIVNLASGAALEPRPYSSAYAGAKAAVLRLTDSLAADLVGSGVRVFALHPGGVRTALTGAIMASTTGQEAYPHWTSLTWQPPEQAAAVVVALAAGEADALVGRYIDATVPLADQIALVAAGDTTTLTLRLARTSRPI